MRSHLAILVGGVVLIGGGVTAVVAADGELPPRPAVGQALSPDGIRLTLSVADTIVRPMEPIDVATTLEYVGNGERITFDSAGWGPVLHVVRDMERDGLSHPIGWNLDCSATEVRRGAVLPLPLRLWAVIDESYPDGAFGRELLSHDDLRLPFGRWAIDAVMRYYPGAGCEGPETWVQATVIVKVEGQPWPTASPAASVAPG